MTTLTAKLQSKVGAGKIVIDPAHDELPAVRESVAIRRSGRNSVMGQTDPLPTTPYCPSLPKLGHCPQLRLLNTAQIGGQNG